MVHGEHYADLYNTYFRHQSLESLNRPPGQVAASAAEYRAAPGNPAVSP
jgi:hypothetical protein